MSLLASDPHVALDRQFPYESRYLTLVVKFALLLQHPGFFIHFNEEQLFDPNYLGFGGYRPGTDESSTVSSANYMPREDAASWVRAMWEKLTADVIRRQPDARLYAEKAPLWLAPRVRQLFPCFTVYNFRDPRDIYISANAFMKKREALGFGRVAGDSDRDHARRLALAFANCFENYYADRVRKDVLLVTYEELMRERAVVVDKIRSLTGLNLITAAGERDSSEVENHATARDRKSSVARWRSETIPEDVIRTLELTLGEAMSFLGYPLSLPSTVALYSRVCMGQAGTGLAALTRFFGHGYLEARSEYALAHVRGNDFHISLPFEPFPADQVKEVWACVQGEIGNHLSLYWRRRDTQFSEQSCVHVPYGPSPDWSVVPFRVGRHPEWKGEITKLRLDLFNNYTQPHHGTGRIRWVQLVN